MSNVPNPAAIDADTLTGELRPLRRAALALGSNLGDRLEFLQAAVDALTESSEIVPVGISSVYETEPIGGPSEQPAFLNAVLKPVLVLLTLPLTLMTLGLFYLVLNGILFALAWCAWRHAGACRPAVSSGHLMV